MVKQTTPTTERKSPYSAVKKVRDRRWWSTMRHCEMGRQPGQEPRPYQYYRLKELKELRKHQEQILERLDRGIARMEGELNAIYNPI